VLPRRAADAGCAAGGFLQELRAVVAAASRVLPRRAADAGCAAGGFLQELRAVASDARLPLHTHTDEGGWEGG
jgi:predicted rRNA methylase YqxC with S4 and FtsJ domains